jgi:hypothetical protein
MTDVLGYLEDKARNPKPHLATRIMPSIPEMAGIMLQSGYNLLDKTRGAMADKKMYGPESAGQMAEDLLNISVGGAPTALAANKAQGPFYSALKGVVEQLPLNKAPGDQWVGTVKNAPGIKQEELDWTGFQKEFSGRPSVTKQEVSDFLEANKVDVQEVMRQDTPELPLKAGTKFSQWQMPGGENYRELLLTLPRKYNSIKDWGPDPNFTTGHYDEPNVLAHVRFNDRYVPHTQEELKNLWGKEFDPKGKKTLFLEEIQSDWHQKGRKEGYRLSSEQTTPMDAEYRALVHKNADARAAGREPDPVDIARAKELEADLIKADNSKIPDAPFKSTWPDLSLKRMIKYAVDNGYDSVSWTPGKVQAERYDLSKQVRRIAWAGDGEADRIVTISPSAGNDIEFRVLSDGKVTGVGRLGGGAGQFDGKSLDEVVGKDMADKILKDRHGDLSGDGLQVGGEGMKAFYDKMLPAAANKLGKKYGAKVGVTKIGNVVKGAAEKRARAGLDEKSQEVWSLPITDAMRKEVGEKGVPLFSGGNSLGALLGQALRGDSEDNSLGAQLQKALRGR